LIPKRLILTDRGEPSAPLIRAAVSSVKAHNPGYEYLFFNDQDVDEFVREEFPAYYPTFRSFRVPIQRYDFFRYLAIYRLGGFYFDTDVVLSRNLDSLLGEECVFPFERLTWSDYLRCELGMDWEIGNYAFGAVPQHPFLKAAIENCVKASRNPEWMRAAIRGLPRLLQQELFVIYSTGPGLLSRTFAEYSQIAKHVTILFPADVCDREHWNLFGEYGIHLSMGRWRSNRRVWWGRLRGVLGRRNEKRAIQYARVRPTLVRPSPSHTAESLPAGSSPFPLQSFDLSTL